MEILRRKNGVEVGGRGRRGGGGGAGRLSLPLYHFPVQPQSHRASGSSPEPPPLAGIHSEGKPGWEGAGGELTEKGPVPCQGAGWGPSRALGLPRLQPGEFPSRRGLSLSFLQKRSQPGSLRGPQPLQAPTQLVLPSPR